MNNFNNLTSSFQNVFSEYIAILKSIKKPNEQSQPLQQSKISRQPRQFHKSQYDFTLINDNHLKSIHSKLNIFLKNLKWIENNHILVQGFYDRNYDELTRIKFFLAKLKNNESRSLHDKIFIKIFKMNKHVPLGITRTFEEFIKGITYFSDEIEHIHHSPIYHRAASCGTSSADFVKKYLRCFKNNIPEIIEQKQNHIYKCYIERLIYDDMFKHSFMRLPTGNGVLSTTSTEQNEGHQFQLTERAHNFNTCFLGIKVDIKLIYEDNFPTILYIYFRDNNGSIIKTEIFERILYFNIYKIGRYTKNVFYKRYDANGEYEEIKRFSGNPYDTDTDSDDEY